MAHQLKIDGLGLDQAGASCGLADGLGGEPMDVGAFRLSRGLHARDVVAGIDRALLMTYSSDAAARSSDIMSK